MTRRARLTHTPGDSISAAIAATLRVDKAAGPIAAAITIETHAEPHLESNPRLHRLLMSAAGVVRDLALAHSGEGSAFG